jgi:MFS family permease
MVSLAIFAGILAATQVGKAHIALPAIRSDLHLSLVAASWLISAMNFLGLFGASLVGILAARYGFRLGCYTLQHLGIMALFPSFFKERFHLPAAAGHLCRWSPSPVR